MSHPTDSVKNHPAFEVDDDGYGFEITTAILDVKDRA